MFKLEKGLIANKVKLIGIAAIIILISVLGGCESTPDIPDIDVNEDLVTDYDIAEIEEERHERYEVFIVINEEATVGELEETAKEVAKQVAEDRSYRALNMIFVDRDEYLDTLGYATLGVIRYQPEGGWGDALYIEPGEYENLEIDSGGLYEKNWEKRPTQKEAEIFATWDYIDWELYEQHEDDIQTIHEMTANELNISVAEVENAVKKVEEWIEMDID